MQTQKQEKLFPGREEPGQGWLWEETDEFA